MRNDVLIKALEDIRDTTKSWEGRAQVPYWNLGDKAAAALKRFNQVNKSTATDYKGDPIPQEYIFDSGDFF